jgi:hypothetical protein
VVDADGVVLGEAIAARPWLVRVNVEEAARATRLAPNGEAGVLAAGLALRKGGAEIAIVTRGVDGAILVDEDGEAWRLGPPPERGPYPVGSGDSFLAGFLTGIAGGSVASEAMRWAVAAGAANALRPGQGAIDPADVTRIRSLVSLEHLPADLPAGSPPSANQPGHAGRHQAVNLEARSGMDTAALPDRRIDPAMVPQRTVTGGARMPAIGLGTFGSDRVSGERIAAAVHDGIRLGYRHIDCAAVYGNERLIGESLERAMADGVSRDDLDHLKLWNDSCPAAGGGRASDRCSTCVWMCSTCTWSTGRSRTPTSPGSTSRRAIRTRSRISTSSSWRRGRRWRSWSTVGWSATSAPRT